MEPSPLRPELPRQGAPHVLAKPTGAICNQDDVLERYIQRLIESHRTSRVTVAWQGGEPTLMGVDFFRRVIAYEQKHKRPGMTFENTLQTNGTLLNDAWCEFLREHGFLIELIIDGQPPFGAVMRGIRLLRKHKVPFRALTRTSPARGATGHCGAEVGAAGGPRRSGSQTNSSAGMSFMLVKP